MRLSHELALMTLPNYRKIIGAGTIYVTINHWRDENGVERIDATQTLSGLNEQKVCSSSLCTIPSLLPFSHLP